MKAWQVTGFAKSFIAFNLASVLSQTADRVVIYSDPEHPYAIWNKSGRVDVVERSADVDHEAQWLVLDGTEHDFEPDGYIYGFTPDQARIQRAAAFKQRSLKPTLLVLVGYGGSYGEIEAHAVIPWDERQTTSVLAGIPLAERDMHVAAVFEALVKQMTGEVREHVGRGQPR